MKQQTNEFIKKLKAAKLTIVLVESITCGLTDNKLSYCVGVAEVFVYFFRLRKPFHPVSANQFQWKAYFGNTLQGASFPVLSRNINIDAAIIDCNIT